MHFGSGRIAAGANPARDVAQHAAVALFFALLALVLTWPLAAHLSTHLPGTGFGDNITFLWSVWLLRDALADPNAS